MTHIISTAHFPPGGSLSRPRPRLPSPPEHWGLSGPTSKTSERTGRPGVLPTALGPSGPLVTGMQVCPSALGSWRATIPVGFLHPQHWVTPFVVSSRSKWAMGTKSRPRCAGPQLRGPASSTYIFMYRCTSAGREDPSNTKSSTITFSVSLGLQ